MPKTDEVRLITAVRAWNICPEDLRNDSSLSHLWRNDRRAGWDYLTDAGERRRRELLADDESGLAEAAAQAQRNRENWARREAGHVATAVTA
jgi:hypothetical protein